MLTSFFFLATPTFATAESLVAREVDARITNIESIENLNGGIRHYIFDALTTAGVPMTVNTRDSHAGGVGYWLDVGDRVILELIDVQDGTTRVYFNDVHRERGLMWLTIVFAILIVLVGLVRGLFSLVGLCVTGLVIYFFILPRIIAGGDPIITTVLASVLILAVNIPLSHGFRRQSSMALVSSLVGLGLVVLFTPIFLYVAQISGLASEEAALLFWELNGLQIPSGILAAGIILATVGVLDDIAITQSEVVDELLLADPHVTRRQLFIRAMRVGRHHIASTVNTLVLVYVGTALPIFLLFMNQSVGLIDFLNTELIAEEIVRTLAGTSALILTVPISTWLATFPHPIVDTSGNRG